VSGIVRTCVPDSRVGGSRKRDLSDLVAPCLSVYLAISARSCVGRGPVYAEDVSGGRFSPAFVVLRSGTFRRPHRYGGFLAYDLRGPIARPIPSLRIPSNQLSCRSAARSLAPPVRWHISALCSVVACRLFGRRIRSFPCLLGCPLGKPPFHSSVLSAFLLRPSP